MADRIMPAISARRPEPLALHRKNWCDTQKRPQIAGKPAAGKRLVIEGFMAELIQRFEEGPIRDALGGAIERRMTQVLGS